MTIHYTILIPLLPFLAGLTIGLLGSRVGEKVYRIGVLAQVFAFVIALQTLYEVSINGSIHINLLPSLSAGGGFLRFGLYVDRLSGVMMVLITGISTIIHLFSRRYMQQERGFSRFYVLLGLTTSVLIFMVASSNLLMLFIFWQLLSWLLYLLSYNYYHPPALQGAFKTYTMLRVGDVAFLAGIVLAYSLYGTLDFPQIFIRAAEVPTTFSLWPGSGLEISAVTAVTLLIFIGAMSKSAQFPMHMWLPASLYAPTPVHALLHAGIINAGGFLLNRLAPLYGLSPTILHVVFAIGALTAVLGACMMLIQNDIKKTLGYSTIGQMGFMIMECGMGAFALAIFHLIAHGLFKATVFLGCGDVIHTARREPRSPPKNEAVETIEFSRLTWLTGFITTLILPLVILLAAHGVLKMPLGDSQGAMIFLFFSWVTSSQVILSLYRLNAVSSWKVAGAMILTLILAVFTYLLAGEAFTYFLYPAPGEAMHYFQAAALPGWLFDLLVAMAALLITLVWVFFYANARGQHILMPTWVNDLQTRLYVLFMNNLYLDTLYLRLGQRVMRFTNRLDKRYLGWLP